MAQLRWSPRAAQDLEDICGYIARDSETYARLFAPRIIAGAAIPCTCERVGPYSGSVRCRSTSCAAKWQYELGASESALRRFDCDRSSGWGSNNGMQRTALRAAADAERYRAPSTYEAGIRFGVAPNRGNVYTCIYSGDLTHNPRQCLHG